MRVRATAWILVAAGCSTGAEGQAEVSSAPPSFDTADDEMGTTESPSVATFGGMSGGSTGGSGGEEGADGGSSTGGAPMGPQTFDKAPDWVSFNLPLGSNDYGWRPTDNAGSDPGEIGGFFGAPTGTSYYADVGITASNQGAIVASGVLDLVDVGGEYNYNTFFGHFSTADPEGGRIGFAILEPQDNGEARIRIEHGTGSVETFVVSELGVDRDWSYEYDPNEAEFGGIRLELEGQGVESYDLSAEDRVAIESLDAFGFVTKQSDNAGEFPGVIELYIDDVDYTR